MAKPWKPEGLVLTVDTPVPEAARALIGTRLAEVRRHAERAVVRSDPEDTHALRVATRRLRAALGLLGGPIAGLADGVKRLGDALGHLRDLDVQLLWLDELLLASPEDEAPGITRLRDQRRGELAPLERLVREALVAFEAHVAQPLELRLRVAGWPATVGGARVRRRVGRRLARVGQRMAALGDGPGHTRVGDAIAVHALRIAAKKARYDLELVEDAFSVAGEALDALKPLQSVIGDLHDADVRAAFLPRFVVAVERREQPGAVRLLAEALRARDRHATALLDQLAAWRDGALADEFAARLAAAD